MSCDKCGQKKYDCRCDGKIYDDDTIFNIKCLYLISIIIWFIIIYLLELWTDDILANLILFIPPIVFLITFFSIDNCTSASEDAILQDDILALGVIVITIILSAENNIFTPFMAKLMVVGIFILSLSFIDFYVHASDIIVLKHIKSITRNAAIVIFLYAFYAFFISAKLKSPSVVNPLKSKPK